jgi:hypothetical protein
MTLREQLGFPVEEIPAFLSGMRGQTDPQAREMVQEIILIQSRAEEFGWDSDIGE